MTLTPEGVEDLADIVRSQQRVRVRGAASKWQSSAADPVIDMRAIRGIVDYSADECVLTARAGTPVGDIAATLAQHGQYLPFDPPFVDEGATIGGAVASGVSGPRRYRYGGVRDFLIGVRIVDGDGRQIRSGGKVVKNAAGFLLHHGMVGSNGRFGILTEVTFKVFPAPEARRTITAACRDAEHAFAVARRLEALRYDCEVIDFDAAGTLSVTVAGRQAAIDARARRVAEAIGGTVLLDADSFHPRGQSSEPVNVPETLVRVAGAMKAWHTLRSRVTAARFMCAGAVAWVTTVDVSGLGAALDAEALVGEIIRGPRAGERVGHVVDNAFEERVRRVLDPHDRFSAAPHPS